MVEILWTSACWAVWGKVTENSVHAWLEQYGGKYTRRSSIKDAYDGAIVFESEEDAIVFKLKFGL